MEAKDNVDVIQLAIKRLMEEKKNRARSTGESESFITDDDVEDQLLLSRLLSQLESLRGDNILKKHEPTSAEMEVNSPGVVEVEEEKREAASATDSTTTEEMVKELRKVKRQNSITHCLLSIMIVLTLAWQVSEVSFILKVKNGVQQPFRSIGSMFTGMLKGRPPSIKLKDEDKDSSSLQIESPAAPPLKMLEIPHMDLSTFGLNRDKD